MNKIFTITLFSLISFLAFAQCTISSAGSSISGLTQSSWGQSFVAECSDDLQSIIFNAATAINSPATLTITNGTDCNAAVLHTQSIDGIVNGDNRIVLNNPLPLTNGNTYYCSVQTNNNAIWKIRFNNTSQIAGSLRTYINGESLNSCERNFANFDWDISFSTSENTSFQLSEFPEDLQFYARNLQTNKAVIPIKGVGNVGDIVKVVILRNGQAYSQQQIQLTNPNFSLNPQIDAELAEYTIQLFITNGGQTSLYQEAERVVAGDVYIITGQSNAESKVFTGSAAENTSDFMRVYGLGTEISTTLTNNLEWFIGQPDGNRDVNGNTGQWGAHMAKQLIDNENIPICIFNGARGGWAISRFQKDNNNPENLNTNYGRLLHRLNRTKLADKVRGIIWYQGESDASISLTTDEYKEAFNRLYDAWEDDYPSVEHTYITQIRDGCSANQDKNVLIQEAHRQLGVELPATTTMSTKGLAHDGCHYPYIGGYKELGRRYYELVSRDLYGENNSAAASPDIAAASFTQNNEITIQTKDGGNLSWQNGAHIYFRLEGSSATIVSGSTEGDKVILQLSANGSSATGITYLDKKQITSPYVINKEGHGLLSFYNFPIKSGEGNNLSISFEEPLNEATYKAGNDIEVEVVANDKSLVSNIRLFLNNQLVRQENFAPYEWSVENQNDPLLQNMKAGIYTLKAVATQVGGGAVESSITIRVSSSVPETCANTSNVALGKPTSQSSTSHNGVASRAVDGNSNGKWSNASVTHTSSQTNSWWRVDLEDVYDLCAIRIYNRTDGCCTSRIEGAFVYAGNTNSTNPNDYTLIGSLNNITTNLFNNLNISARYIMVRHAGTGLLSLAEVEIDGSSNNKRIKSVTELSILPNPAQDYINITLQNYDDSNIEYFISSLNGQIVSKGRLNLNNGKANPIDVSNLQNGVYLINLQSDNKQTVTQKLMIIRE